MYRHARTSAKVSSLMLVAVAMAVIPTQPVAAAADQGGGRAAEATRPFAGEVPCNSGPVEPIQLRVIDGGDICFGGPPGVESVGLPIAFMDSGDYTGNIIIQNGQQCTVQPFRPRRVRAVNATVCAIEITQPPRGLDG